jgi:hypothetical protein
MSNRNGQDSGRIVNGAVPLQTFKAVMEDFHHAVGVASGISEPTRNLLMGRIEGYMQQHAFVDPLSMQEEARELIYAAERAARIAQMTNLSMEQRKEKMRETMAPYLKRPVPAGAAEQ